MQHLTGNWALIFLCITLAITPFRRLLHQNWLIRFRRMVGLFAFWYGCLHLLTYIVFDQFFDFPAMLHDVVKRPFITAGMAFTLMIPLAITSTSGWVVDGRQALVTAAPRRVASAPSCGRGPLLLAGEGTKPAVRFAVVVGVLLGYRVLHSLMGEETLSRRAESRRKATRHLF